MGIVDKLPMVLIEFMICTCILIFILYKLIIIVNYIQDQRFTRHILIKKKNVWIQRIFITLIITSLFLNYVVQDGNQMTTTISDENNNFLENRNHQISSPNNDLFGQQDPLFQYIENFILSEVKTNPDGLLKDINSIEATIFIITQLQNQLNNSRASNVQSELINLNKFIKSVVKELLSILDPERFYYESVSKTIFVAEILSNIGYLDKTIGEISHFLGEDMNNPIPNKITERNLKDLFRSELLVEIMENPISLIPNNDNYEPAISHAIKIGLLELSDLGIPERGITKEDYSKSQNNYLDVKNIQTNSQGYSFKKLNSSMFTLFGNKSLNFTLPTMGDYFSTEEMGNLTYDEQRNIMSMSIPYTWEIGISEIPSYLISPIMTELNLIYWTNMTVVNKTMEYQVYDYSENENAELKYELNNNSVIIPYYVESEGYWESIEGKWQYHNVSNGKWVWNSTSQEGIGLREFLPIYNYNLSIKDEENRIEEITDEFTYIESISGEIFPKGRNQTYLLSIEQKLYDSKYIQSYNQSELFNYLTQLLKINDKYYYLPKNLFNNISEFEYKTDASGKIIIPTGAIEIK
jgi:hypothetical protein